MKKVYESGIICVINYVIFQSARVFVFGCVCYMRNGAFNFNENKRRENDIRNRGRMVKDFNTFRCEMFCLFMW